MALGHIYYDQNELINEEEKKSNETVPFNIFYGTIWEKLTGLVKVKGTAASDSWQLYATFPLSIVDIATE